MIEHATIKTWHIARIFFLVQYIESMQPEGVHHIGQGIGYQSRKDEWDRAREEIHERKSSNTSYVIGMEGVTGMEDVLQVVTEQGVDEATAIEMIKDDWGRSRSVDLRW